MRKNILKISLLSFIAFIFVTGCGNKAKYNGDITSFKYHFGSGEGSIYEYDINVNNGNVMFIAKGYAGARNLNINKQIDGSYLKQLSIIIKDNNIDNWNKFDKSAEGLLDGYSFTLEVHYSDGKVIKAHGYEEYPDNYKSAHKKLSEFLKSIK